MPAYSKLEDLHEADQQGQIPLTRRLVQIFADPEALRDHPHFAQFSTVGHMNVIDDGCREVLHLEQGFIDHLNEWPNHLKEQARAAAAEAVQKGQRLSFSWHLTRGRDEKVELTEEDDGLSITFLSPRSKALVPATASNGQLRPATEPA